MQSTVTAHVGSLQSLFTWNFSSHLPWELHNLLISHSGNTRRPLKKRLRTINCCSLRVLLFLHIHTPYPPSLLLWRLRERIPKLAKELKGGWGHTLFYTLGILWGRWEGRYHDWGLASQTYKSELGVSKPGQGSELKSGVEPNIRAGNQSQRPGHRLKTRQEGKHQGQVRKAWLRSQARRLGPM